MLNEAFMKWFEKPNRNDHLISYNHFAAKVTKVLQIHKEILNIKF